MADEIEPEFPPGWIPVDLTGGMLDAMLNPPPGFKSKFRFEKTDLRARIARILWFVHCGDPLAVDLTMGYRQVPNWSEATQYCKSESWADAGREAQNQLTLFLATHDPDNYDRWNDIAIGFKQDILGPLRKEKFAPYQAAQGLDEAVIWMVESDIQGAWMENAYIESGHSAFFFLELLRIFEAGHFPCGWEGQWPQGSLVVY
jgi:hypothetical protein